MALIRLTWSLPPHPLPIDPGAIVKFCPEPLAPPSDLGHQCGLPALLQICLCLPLGGLGRAKVAQWFPSFPLGLSVLLFWAWSAVFGPRVDPGCCHWT